MRHANFHVLRAIILTNDVESVRRLETTLSADRRYEVVSLHTNLDMTRAAVGSDPIDVVVCNRAVHHIDGFTEFQASAIAAGCHIVTVPSDASAEHISRAVGSWIAAHPRGNSPDNLDVASKRKRSHRLVVIGASTGGIDALHQVLSAYPDTCPPTAIVQHIKPDFLSGVVARLDRICAAHVVEATDRMLLRPGLIAVAPGLECHLVVDPTSLRCRLRHAPPVSGHRPSVDRLFQSAAPLGASAVGVILTGMGRDGATGLAAMHRAGAWTIAQDEASSTVFGMPRVAQEEGAVSEMLPLRRIGPAILRAAGKFTEVDR